MAPTASATTTTAITPSTNAATTTSANNNKDQTRPDEYSRCDVRAIRDGAKVEARGSQGLGSRGKRQVKLTGEGRR